MTHLPYWIDIYFRTCHVKIKQKSQPLPLTIILYYKSTLQLHPIFKCKLLVCGLMIIWKHFSIQTHNPSALWILQGDIKWEVEEEEEREGIKILPVAVRGWGNMKMFLLSFHLYTVLSNAYNINSAGFSWAATQKFSSCKQCIYKCVY